MNHWTLLPHANLFPPSMHMPCSTYVEGGRRGGSGMRLSLFMILEAIRAGVGWVWDHSYYTIIYRLMQWLHLPALVCGCG